MGSCPDTDIDPSFLFDILDEIPWALRFLEEPADTQFAHTRSAILNCKVEDRPKATITWQIARTGYPINKNITGVRYILPNGSLYFPAFAVDKFTASVHNTDYQCNATNSVGTLISRIAKLRAGKWMRGKGERTILGPSKNLQ